MALGDKKRYGRIGKLMMKQPNRWTQLDLFAKSAAPRPDSSKPPFCTDTEEAHRHRIIGYLSFQLPAPVDLVFTNNRSTMISYSLRQGRYQIRLHRLFRHADEFVLKALARFIVGRKHNTSQILDDFIAAHRDEIQASRRERPRQLKEQGVHHDLKAYLRKVADTYFGGYADVRIGWTRLNRRKTRRRSRTVSRALATYSYEDRTIRVSPILDAANVPSYVVEWIIYHELLHHVLPVKQVGGKNQYHTAQFRALERAFKDFERAKKWEAEHLEQLLR